VPGKYLSNKKVPGEIFPYFLQKVKAENRFFCKKSTLKKRFLGKKSRLKKEVLDKKSRLRMFNGKCY
jgi:hypothetical protein